LQEQNARRRILLAEGSDSELGMDGVIRTPLFIAQPIRFLEGNFSLDSNQNSSPEEEVSSSFRANVGVFFLEQFGSIRLAESARRRDDAAENERSECNRGIG
jgi:hypothetical protein